MTHPLNRPLTHDTERAWHDPTRPLPNLVPQPDGSWTGRTVLTPTALTTRGVHDAAVEGDAGDRRAGDHGEQSAGGEPAWRAPNGTGAGLYAAFLWKRRRARQRQELLDPDTLEVDGRGDIDLPLDARSHGISENEVRDLYWGEVHWDSYGKLLYGLHVGLNHTFEMDALHDVRAICRHWKEVMACDPARWGARAIDRLTESELEKHAAYFYPVYACGYNWLESCADSAGRLRTRIEHLIAFWAERKRQCEKVILVTHSMGGLVARACARQIPERILGVVHGAMPALGAPVCYRRIACGTEKWRPGQGGLAGAEAECVADILGERPEATMAVMGTSPGALELLPNHLYPQPWLHVLTVSRVKDKDQGRDLMRLPMGNPYDFYRDMDSWLRLVDPQLADPAGKYADKAGGVREAVLAAVKRAEHFHRDILGNYYHPHTYAFYGADPAHMSFGALHWVARDPGNGAVFTEANLRDAAGIAYGPSGGRRVRVEGRTELHFLPARQDAAGDGTVPHQSGAGPREQVTQLFALRGIDHQTVFNDDAVLLLTRHLIAKLVQKMP
jgi:pimeloyl-ACP methyl ester carboxylesterase